MYYHANCGRMNWGGFLRGKSWIMVGVSLLATNKDPRQSKTPTRGESIRQTRLPDSGHATRVNAIVAISVPEASISGTLAGILPLRQLEHSWCRNRTGPKFSTPDQFWTSVSMLHFWTTAYRSHPPDTKGTPVIDSDMRHQPTVAKKYREARVASCPSKVAGRRQGVTVPRCR
ncbi:hypothetical protein BDN67DRAFT_968777 [Paxillus ammoniavirescens]|nr:hypothetical protein BDN67DRAFT_968777 [Paxillus ammoniavirescens]